MLLILVRSLRGIRTRRREAPGDVLEHGRLTGKPAVQVGMQRRSPVPGPIDDVHLEAFLNQILEPPRTAVRRPHPVGALTSATVHQDDGERMTDLRGDHVLDVHLLAANERAARGVGPSHVDPHVAPLGDVEGHLARNRSSLLRQTGGVGH